MSEYSIHDTTLTDIANVIREKNNNSTQIYPSDFSNRISRFGKLEEKTISQTKTAEINAAEGGAHFGGYIDITGIQQGTGTPSISNKKPIKTLNTIDINVYPIDCSLLYTQSGTGTPSPSNIRPITPGLSIIRDDDSVLNVYGGSLNINTGELIITRVADDLGDLTWTKSSGTFNSSLTEYTKGPSSKYKSTIVCTLYETEAEYYVSSATYAIAIGTNKTKTVYVRDATRYSSTPENFKTYVSGQKVVYELYSSKTVQLSQTELERAKEYLSTKYTTKIPNTYNMFSGRIYFDTNVFGISSKFVDLSSWDWTYNAVEKRFESVNTMPEDHADISSQTIPSNTYWKCSTFSFNSYNNTYYTPESYDDTICIAPNNTENKGHLFISCQRIINESDPVAALKYILTGEKLTYQVDSSLPSPKMDNFKITTLEGANKIWVTDDELALHLKYYITSKLGTKSISANGTYMAENENLGGYSKVTVSVPMPVIPGFDYYNVYVNEGLAIDINGDIVENENYCCTDFIELETDSSLTDEPRDVMFDVGNPYGGNYYEGLRLYYENEEFYDYWNANSRFRIVNFDDFYENGMLVRLSMKREYAEKTILVDYKGKRIYSFMNYGYLKFDYN